MHWLNHLPDDLIERFEPAEALALLRQEPTLPPERMAKLDVYIQHWTLVLLQRASDPQGVQEMLTLCEIAQDLAPESTEGHTMRQRWNGFEDLLEAKRRHLLANRHAAPVPLKQQDAILQLIQRSRQGRVKQLDLAEELRLSKGRVSQILGVLEARAIITRQREGKESWVSLAPSGTAPATPHQNPPTPSSAHLGKTVFALRKAA
jgi:uncharacterized membrane protein